MKHNTRIPEKALLYFLVLVSCCLFSVQTAPAAGPANISADHMEYLSESKTYIAKGSAVIVFEDATLRADEMRLNSVTSEAEATGNVVYEDSDAIITADRIELNVKTKLGKIYKSYIFYKKHNFHLHAGNIKKVEEKSFFLDRASLTTCDADPPQWHISGAKINVTQNEKITARNATFNIKNIPVLYTPYFWAPLNRDRQTGFLFPSFGYSSTRGQYYKQGFFWAIAENQDASLYLDYYTEKGLAEGLDYRYVISPEANGELWVYHVRDDEPSRSLFEIKGYHNQQFEHDIAGYVKIHAVNEFDYYETMDSTSFNRFGLSSWETDPFGFSSEERLQKYLESDIHLSKSLPRSRIYVLGQGRQSLEGSSREIPQSAPEIGFILNTGSIKNLAFNMAARGTNFWREEGQKGQRFDVNPNLYFSYGRLINITQKAGLRETYYLLKNPSVDKNRLIFDLGTAVTTKFFKKYSDFIHIIEPSLEYTYIPSVNQDEIASFDSADFIPQTSSFTYSLTNRVSGLSSTYLEMRFRLSQSYSLLDVEKQFSPVLAEAALSSKNLSLNVNASYDVYDERFSETIGSFKLENKTGYAGAGKNFRRSSGLDQVTLEAGIYNPIKFFKLRLPIDFHTRLWYDLKGGGIQQLDLKSTYTHQCWGFTVLYTKKPEEYQIFFTVNLAGLGSLNLASLGELNTGSINR